MRALISVSDKTGVVDFAKGLRALGWEVIATGGTMKLLSDSGVEVINISDVTGFPEICDGRVKTLHPNVHGGLLARRDDPEHLKALKDNNIEFIDMVCVNLYPFRQTIAKPDVKMEDAIENIDIGGPSMLRSAAKNWADVTVVCDPADYEQVLGEIRAGGNTEKATRLKLSAKAYTHTAEYDAMIAAYMRAQAGLNEKLFLEFDLVQSLRYGENPHQSAKFYREEKEVPYSLAFARQLNGKELSYNNIQDANAALCIVREFDEPFCVGLKHMNPCGAAVGKDVVDAWTKAYEADKVSIFGGIVATNRTVTREAAELMKPIFLEIIMAPKFDEGALEVLCTKKNLRLLEVDMQQGDADSKQYVSVNGGLLVQDHKRAFDGDKGPNTGGMGAYSPLPFITAEDERYALEKVLQPTADAMVAEGCPFEGVLYGGLMKTPQGIKVIEFNARFGDPETEVVLPRLKSDIVDIFCAVADGGDTQLVWHDFATLGIVLASKGYPGAYEKGCEIKGLDRVEGALYHMGTKADGSRILTSGGRVLFVVGKGATLAEARANALRDVARIGCDNLFHRTDIGHWAFEN